MITGATTVSLSSTTVFSSHRTGSQLLKHRKSNGVGFLHNPISVDNMLNLGNFGSVFNQDIRLQKTGIAMDRTS